MADEMNEKMAMVAGDNAPKLNRAEKDKLSRSYLDLFIGLSAANWARGGDKTLGAAWYEAMGQIKAMLGARDKNNPVTEYLQQVHAVHNIQMSRQMMTNPNKDSVLDLSEIQRNTWNSHANKRVGDAMQVVNEMTAKYQEKVKNATPEKLPNKKFPSQFAVARQIMLMKIAMDGRDQRAA